VDFVEQLKSAIDIVRVIGEYVRLRRVGATGRYVGLCPFHQEKTPSFNVHQTRQFYKCFGCGVSGDVLKFVMEVDGLTFPETLKLLAERNGIPMPKRTEYADAESKLRGALMDMHAIAAQMFQANLKSDQGSAARAYLARRGVSAESIETFQLGYSDSSGQALVRRLSDEHFTPEQMEASGLVRRRKESAGFYDSFRGRLMFPIDNESGKVIAFGGRAMRDEDEPKYLNSPETPIYRKTSVLYNLHRAREGMRKSDRVVLVEGYMDVIGVHSAGVKEVVASCGTALTNAQVRAIHRHADTVVVNFDPDRAGADAAERAIQLFLDEGVRVRVLALEGGLDPDDFVKQHGAEVYQAKLDSASGYFHWLADRARVKYDMKTPEGRVDAFKFLLPAVQKLPDKLERAAVANDLASYLGVDAALVLDQLKRAGQDRKPGAVTAPRAPSIPELEKILLGAMISSSQARAQVLDRLTPELTANFVTREIFEALRQVAGANGASGSTIDFSALDGRLSPGGQTLLHQAFMADETIEESVFLEQAEACVRRLESDARRRQVDDLRAQVKAAEREGRMADAILLMEMLLKREKEFRTGT
jgi:DNA primase